MRRIALASALVGVCLIAACGKTKDTGADTAPVTPPPPPPPSDHRAIITFRCIGDGANIDVHPWRVPNVTKADGIDWFAPQSGVWITPKDPNNWPFDTNRIDVAAGTTVNSKNFKPVVEKGTYKYLINGECVTAAGTDTVVLDPDMIIPTRIQMQ